MDDIEYWSNQADQAYERDGKPRVVIWSASGGYQVFLADKVHVSDIKYRTGEENNGV